MMNLSNTSNVVPRILYNFFHSLPEYLDTTDIDTLMGCHQYALEKL